MIAGAVAIVVGILVVIGICALLVQSWTLSAG
jgi:hypothetical protein